MGVWRKITNTFRRGQLQEDVADELAFHLERRERENRERGMTAEAAGTAARRKFGNVTLAKERTADSDVVRWVE